MSLVEEVMYVRWSSSTARGCRGYRRWSEFCSTGRAARLELMMKVELRRSRRRRGARGGEEVGGEGSWVSLLSSHGGVRRSSSGLGWWCSGFQGDRGCLKGNKAVAGVEHGVELEMRVEKSKVMKRVALTWIAGGELGQRCEEVKEDDGFDGKKKMVKRRKMKLGRRSWVAAVGAWVAGSCDDGDADDVVRMRVMVKIAGGMEVARRSWLIGAG